MTKQFEVSANGTVFGTYEADDAQGARDACARDAGYKSEADMAKQLGQGSELVAEERQTLVTGFELTEAGVAKWNAWLEQHARDGVDLQATTLEMLRKVEEHFTGGEALVYELGGHYTLTGRPELFELGTDDVDATTEQAGD